MTVNETPNMGDMFKDTAKVTKAVTEAVHNAARVHKLLGIPMAIWRDGKVVIVPPEEIDVPPSDTPPQLPIF